MADHVIAENDAERSLVARKACIDAGHRRRRPRRIPKEICRCGYCPRCLDNARWERIYEERFADPSYYRQFGIRSSSPLSGL
jgi:hypothetical protein